MYVCGCVEVFRERKIKDNIPCTLLSPYVPEFLTQLQAPPLPYASHTLSAWLSFIAHRSSAHHMSPCAQDALTQADSMSCPTGRFLRNPKSSCNSHTSLVLEEGEMQKWASNQPTHILWSGFWEGFVRLLFSVSHYIKPRFGCHDIVG